MSDLSMVWRALVAYLGDPAQAESAVSAIVADHSEPAAAQDLGQHWRNIFDRARDPSSVVADWVPLSVSSSDNSVELLSVYHPNDPNDPNDLNGSNRRVDSGRTVADTSGPSRLLAALGGFSDQQRRALIAVHVCGLTVAQVAAMLQASLAEFASLIAAGEAMLDDQPELRGKVDVLASPTDVTANWFATLHEVSLPLGLRRAAIGPGGHRVDTTTAFTTLVVGSVAVVALVLIAGNPGVVEAPEAGQASPQVTATTNPSPAAPTTESALQRQQAAEAELALERELALALAARLQLESSLQGPDRSEEISVSPAGEIVRLDLRSGDVVWRTSPLGDIELTSVDLNTVTFRKDGVVLRLSLADGTFLPP